MAQTMTLRAQSTLDRKDARFSSPASLRASRYFISPAWPCAIQRGKEFNSGKSRTGAIPAKSKPADLAVSFTNSARGAPSDIGNKQEGGGPPAGQPPGRWRYIRALPASLSLSG